MVDQALGSRYVLQGLLGRGAMGQVFRGSVRGSDASVAVKVLKPELVSDPDVVARFFQERSILTSIDHPNVVRVSDLVVEGETLGIVMDLVEGPDLRRVLREQGTLAPADAVEVVCQLLDGLAAVHAAGIVHRDVKPENMLVDVAGGVSRVRLTDFGVARLTYGGSLTKLSSLIGTPEYMAPEIADHDSGAPAADLYSVGVVLYELLCGRTPFAGGHPMAVLRRHIEQPPSPIPGLPAPLWAQLEVLLAKDPAARPASAAQAAGALRQLTASLAGQPALPPMAAPGPDAWTPSRVSRPISATPVPGSPATVPDGPQAQVTVARHRSRGAGVGNGSAAAPSPAPPAPRSRKRRALIIGVPTALALVAAAVAAVFLARSNGAPPVAGPAVAESYAFAPQEYHDGLLVVRRWKLSGKGGSLLTETLSISNPTSKAKRVALKEAIPAAIAPTLRTVHFSPSPTKVLQADPIVEWNLRVPAQGVVRVGYQSRVPAVGAVKTRLLRWARALTSIDARVNQGAVTVQIRSLTAKPQLLRLANRASARLKLSGVLSSGKRAPHALVAAAAWTTGNPAVAVIGPSGLVTATGRGTTYVTAQLGSASTRAVVVVAGIPAGPTATGTVTPTSRPSSPSGGGPTQKPTPPTQPAPGPVNRRAITSYNQMRGGAPDHGFFTTAWQSFTAESNTITWISATVGNPSGTGAASPVQRICNDTSCSPIVAKEHP